MIKIENVVLPSPEQWKAIIIGARNPLNSWSKSDSQFDESDVFDPDDYKCGFKLGDNDHSLMTKLAKAGTDHRKFMRMITVYANITAPLYWWKEFDAYKVGTVANSCSTMHKIAEKEFTLEDFSTEHLMEWSDYEDEVKDLKPDRMCNFKFYMLDTISALNNARELYLAAANKLKRFDLTEAERKHTAAQKKRFWWQMIQLLPSSYNQKRTVMLNYEALANMYKSRKNHKLDEWRDFCKWLEMLPYSELITGKENI